MQLLWGSRCQLMARMTANGLDSGVIYGIHLLASPALCCSMPRSSIGIATGSAAPRGSAGDGAAPRHASHCCMHAGVRGRLG